MKYFVVCPYCGYDLLKTDGDSHIEICCFNCNENIAIDSTIDKLVICQIKPLQSQNEKK